MSRLQGSFKTGKLINNRKTSSHKAQPQLGILILTVRFQSLANCHGLLEGISGFHQHLASCNTVVIPCLSRRMTPICIGVRSFFATCKAELKKKYSKLTRPMVTTVTVDAGALFKLLTTALSGKPYLLCYM